MSELIDGECACSGCGIRPLMESSFFACDICAQRYPASLLKACGDYFDYCLRLRSGELVRFSEARIDGEYVHLRGGSANRAGEDVFEGFPISAPRGLDVRISDIVWCADAPEGS